MEKVLQQLTGKINLESVSKDELRHLTDSCPYFAPAQFLLAAKLKNQNNQGFLPQAQKTVLFFNNPYWMHYQLQSNESDNNLIIGHPVYQEEEYQPKLKNVIEEETHQQPFAIPTVEEVKEMMREIDQQDDIVTEAKPALVEVVDEPIHVPEPIATVETIQEMTSVEIAEQTPPQEIIEELIIEEPTPVAVVEEIIAAEAKVEETLPITETEIPTTQLKQETILEQNNHQQEEQSQEAIKEAVAISKEVVFESHTPTEEEIAEVEDAIPDEHSNKIAAILNHQLAEFNKPVVGDAHLKMDGEPFHTVDYFASQGIKVNLEQPPIDRLTSQLRRFTDWLKHIKNVEPDEEDINADPELESAIQGIASSSNEAREIVTETMAEVLEKQGKKDKAIQLYIKLSFLNPDKSAYFASKIQQLKGI